MDVREGHIEGHRPLLCLGALESCELVWTDAYIIEYLKVAILEDSALAPILTFFKEDSQKIPTDIRHRLQDYTFLGGVFKFKDKIHVRQDEELPRQIVGSRHDVPAARYQGRAKTLELVTRIFN